MKKERLNLKKEYGALSTSSKRVWDEAVEEIEVMAEELGLTKTQKEAYLHKTMSEIRYADLDATNKYLSRTKDEYSVRAIKKNKLEMQRLKASHEELYKEVKGFDEKAQQTIANNRQVNKKKAVSKPRVNQVSKKAA